jgi:hypothetical protein
MYNAFPLPPSPVIDNVDSDQECIDVSFNQS